MAGRWAGGTFRRGLAGIAIVGLGLRVAYVLGAKRSQPLLGDALYYEAQARTIAAGRWFDSPFAPGSPAADHPPLNALVLSPIAHTFPGSITPMRLLLCVVGALTVVLVGLLGRRVAGARVGLVAAGLAAVYPGLWVNDAILMAESVTAACVAAVLLGAYAVRDRPSPTRAALLGGAVGLAALARAELALLGPLVAVPVVLAPLRSRPLPWRTVLPALGAVTLAAGVVVAPWVVANLARFDRPTLLSTGEGHVTAGANCPSTYGGPGLGFWSLECAFFAPDAPTGVDQSELAAWYQDRGEAYRSDHLDRLPVVMAARVGRVWSAWRVGQMTWLNEGEGKERWVSNLAVATFWVLVPLAVVGIVRARRQRLVTWPLLVPFVLVTVLAAWYYGNVRFRLPAEIPLVVLGAIALALQRPPAPEEPATSSSPVAVAG